MPIFEYKCNVCGKEFEILSSHSANVICPECQSEKLTKKFSLFATPPKTESIPDCASSCSDFKGSGCENSQCCCGDSF